MTRNIYCSIFLVGFCSTFFAGTWAAANEGNSSEPSEVVVQESTESHPSSGFFPTPIEHGLHLACETIQVALSNYWKLVFPMGLIVLIKRYMLKQPYPEILACGIDVIVYLLRHPIDVVRYFIIMLKKLADELRAEVVNTNDH